MHRSLHRTLVAVLSAAVLYLPALPAAADGHGSGHGRHQGAPDDVVFVANGWSTGAYVRAAEGGVLRIEGVVKVEIPAGALPEDMVISVHAEVVQAGARRFLSLTFGPHGTVFAKPLRVTASTAFLHADTSGDTVWYAQNATGDQLEWVESDATVEDGPSGEPDMHGRRLVFEVHHFSRYALGSIVRPDYFTPVGGFVWLTPLW